MRLLTLSFLLLTFLFLSCNNKSANQSFVDSSIEEIPINSAFEEFLDTIPTYQLPLLIKCGFKGAIFGEAFYEHYQQFIPEYLRVVGKLDTSSDLSLVLFGGISDILYPYLYTFDKVGNRIDSVDLHIHTCVGDAYLVSYNWTLIEPDLSINMVDTTKYFSIIETGRDYTSILDSIIIRKRTIKMDEKGSFHKTSEESNKQLPTAG
jgi:hypothetical protein